jgi:lipopolysaccharide assembly outer membrane protein LptD (OstA)
MPQLRQDRSNQIVILADNVVGWQSTTIDGGTRWEVYLEGNVVFAKDRRVIYCERMYYDANFQQGTILGADVLTSVPQYQGLVRLKADVVQQVDQNNLQAFGAAFTTSRMGVPRYWLQSDNLSIDRRTTNILPIVVETGFTSAIFRSFSGRVFKPV